jgi:hypothetical protein
MSDTTAEAAEGKNRKARSGGDRTGNILFAVLLLLLPIAPSTFTVLAVYMAPTLIVACFRSMQLPGAITTVAGLNFAGSMPALYYLWTRGNDFETAFSLLFNLEFIGINMAGAAVGISLLWIAPFIAQTWVDIASDHLLHRAKAERVKLLDEWGEDLAGDSDADDNAEAPSGDTENK